MPLRSYGVQSATTATPQPVFGVTTTAAVTPSPDPYTNSFAPGSHLPPVIIPVNKINARVPFIQGDPVNVGPAGGPYEPALVLAVDQTGSTITVSGLLKPHTSGEYVILAINCARVVIQAVDTNTGPLYVGIDHTVSATDYTTIYEIWKAPTTGALPEYHSAEAVDAQEAKSENYWIVGATGDKFLAHIFQI